MKPSDILLTDQVCLITGGASGIGAGIAHGYARFGAKVVIADIDIQTANDTAADIRHQGGNALAIACDVMDEAQIKAACDHAMNSYGRLDSLVNNAAGVRSAEFLSMSSRSRERHLQINLMNLFSATDTAARHMIAGGRGGTILNIASIEGQRAAPNFSIYAACKAAMLSFTKTMALELAQHGIRVNALAPDFVETPGMSRMRGGPEDEYALRARRRYIPLGRDGDLDDCAGAAIFLASSMASYITGVTLNVDGGTKAASGWTRREAGGDWSLFLR